MSKTAQIYALSDPSKPSLPLYIGRTRHSLRQRLYEHFVTAFRETNKNPKLAKWLIGLDAAKKIPVVTLYEICDLDKASEREKYWTLFFRPLGTLLNIKTGDSQPVGSDIVSRRRKWMESPNGKKWAANVRNKHHEKQPSLFVWANRKHFKGMRDLGSKKHWRPVICVETGKRFESVSDARRFTKSGNLVQAIERGWKCGGFHWKFAEPKIAQA